MCRLFLSNVEKADWHHICSAVTSLVFLASIVRQEGKSGRQGQYEFITQKKCDCLHRTSKRMLIAAIRTNKSSSKVTGYKSDKKEINRMYIY